MLHLLRLAVVRAQVRLEHAPEELQEDLEARLGDGRVVAALAQLVADEGVLRPRELVEAEDDAGLAELQPDQVPPGVRHVRVLDAEDHGHLALEPGQQIERVGAPGGRLGAGVGRRVGPERARVHVRGEVADRCGDPGVQLWAAGVSV